MPEGAPFPLSCRIAADRIGAKHTAVAERIKDLLRAGALVKASAGHRKMKLAATYFYRTLLGGGIAS
jgi:hypothetical protein